MIQASLMHFELEEAQWQRDWANLLAIASQPGASLEQLHIFALAHIFRRPIVVYGVKLVKSFRGEDIGLARFEGVYLPLLWDVREEDCEMLVGLYLMTKITSTYSPASVHDHPSPWDTREDISVHWCRRTRPDWRLQTMRTTLRSCR